VPLQAPDAGVDEGNGGLSLHQSPVSPEEWTQVSATLCTPSRVSIQAPRMSPASTVTFIEYVFTPDPVGTCGELEPTSANEFVPFGRQTTASISLPADTALVLHVVTVPDEGNVYAGPLDTPVGMTIPSQELVALKVWPTSASAGSTNPAAAATTMQTSTMRAQAGIPRSAQPASPGPQSPRRSLESVIWPTRSPAASVCPWCHERAATHRRGRAMELGGLEPPTSWVRSRRSPN
jgi:hypothetical protein